MLIRLFFYSLLVVEFENDSDLTTCVKIKYSKVVAPSRSYDVTFNTHAILFPLPSPDQDMTLYRTVLAVKNGGPAGLPSNIDWLFAIGE